jgi:glycosyltransferase involved in cell wall biosynthesis
MQVVQQYLPVVIIAFFFFATAIQLFYYLFFYARLSFHRHKPTENDCEPVSVIICAKNEAEHLEKFLKKVLEQEYPTFEVIVVNDCSSDETEMVLAQMKMRYKNLRYTNITEDKTFKHNKKLAISVGVKAAKYEVLVFTDADCYPESTKWLYNIQQGFGWNKEIVLGYGGFEERAGFLNKLIRFDSIFVAMNYLGFAKAGIPYMGVGRNLAYKKSLFFKNKGFATNYELNSGDDDLFVNETATKNNTKVIVTNESIVRTIPKETFDEYYMQKRRHLTTASRYHRHHQVLLLGELASRFLCYATIIPAVLITPRPLMWYIAGVFGLRMVTHLVIIKLSMIKLKEKNLLLYSPLFDVLLPIIHLMVHISNYTYAQRRKNKWK